MWERTIALSSTGRVAKAGVQVDHLAPICTATRGWVVTTCALPVGGGREGERVYRPSRGDMYCNARLGCDDCAPPSVGRKFPRKKRTDVTFDID